jgi:hypothetical protein
VVESGQLLQRAFAVDRVHRLSHGLAADEILEVVEGS